MLNLTRSIVFDVETLRIVDQLAETEERSRSQTVRWLIRKEGWRRDLLHGSTDGLRNQEVKDE
jgi:hypothetical protein